MTYQRETAMSAPVPARPAKIVFIDNFRAIAIFLIVAGHMYWLAFPVFPPPEGYLINVLLNLITGGTAYFVFISGFLYYHVFSGRLNYAAFINKKVENVVVPYLVLGFPLAVYTILVGNWDVSVQSSDGPVLDSVFVTLVFLLSTGNMMQAYWFIPFIFLLFLMSPLFDAFIRLRREWGWLLFGAAAAVALVLHRPPVPDVDQIQNVLYFLPFYLFGILCARDRLAFVRLIGRPDMLVLSGVGLIAFAAIQGLLIGHVGNIRAEPFTPVFDFMFVQKMVGILFLCSILHIFAEPLAATLNHVAKLSFGVFFLHPIIAFVIGGVTDGAPPRSGNPWLDLAIYALLVFALSLLATSTVKLALGGRSRVVVGA
ncbi:MAG: acyltransferase family protein [Bacteroidetes bacterium]|jgi:surface polysaccharide O-acyltransferase-like enzyme|nr:acyltransferase family protein [Bacteroidota bacterium]